MKKYQLAAKLPAATILLAAIFILSSCKKDPADTGRKVMTDYLKFSTIGLQYVKLPLNAYYIYKDSATGILDSVVVTKSSVEKKFQSAFVTSITIFNNTTTYNIPDHYYDSLSIVLTRFAGTAQEEWLSFNHNNNNVFNLFSGADSTIYLDNEKAGSRMFTYPLPYGGGYEFLPSITLEGKTYTEVIKVAYVFQNNTLWKRYAYYWAKGIGLIKRTEVTSTSDKTWTLVRNG